MTLTLSQSPNISKPIWFSTTDLYCDSVWIYRWWILRVQCAKQHEPGKHNNSLLCLSIREALELDTSYLTWKPSLSAYYTSPHACQRFNIVSRQCQLQCGGEAQITFHRTTNFCTEKKAVQCTSSSRAKITMWHRACLSDKLSCIATLCLRICVYF